MLWIPSQNPPSPCNVSAHEVANDLHKGQFSIQEHPLMKPYRCRVCTYVGCEKRQTLLIYKFCTEILSTEGYGVTSEAKGKLLWGTTPALRRQPTLGTKAALQAWGGHRSTKEERASPAVHAVFAHTQQSVPAVLQNRNLSPSGCQNGNLSPSGCQKGNLLRPVFVFSVVLFIFFPLATQSTHAVLILFCSAHLMHQFPPASTGTRSRLHV